MNKGKYKQRYVHELEMAPDTTEVPETIIDMPCSADKSRQPNSTKPFRSLNYNHFQSDRTTTESWSWSV